MIVSCLIFIFSRFVMKHREDPTAPCGNGIDTDYILGDVDDDKTQD